MRIDQIVEALIENEDVTLQYCIYDKESKVYELAYFNGCVDADDIGELVELAESLDLSLIEHKDEVMKFKLRG